MAYVLGRVLWCVFEAQPSSNAAEFMGAEVFQEPHPDHRFPAFRHIPLNVRQLIRRCTHDAPEWASEKRCVERAGDYVYTAGRARPGGLLP